MSASNMNAVIYKIKGSKIIRVMSSPMVNMIRSWRKCFYRFSEDSAKVRKLKDSHSGEKCFIIGNGPSLTIQDLESISGNFSFAANRIFELFDKTEWRPDVYLSVDNNVIKDNLDKMVELNLDKIFIQLEAKKYGLQKKNKKIVYVNNYYPFYVNRYKRVKVDFSKDPSKYFAAGETVVYNAVQLAVYMGFKEIYLMGVDHRYSKRQLSTGEVIVDKSVKDYFGDLDTKSYNIQNIDTSTNAFRRARIECENMGIRLANATRGGALEVLERVELESVL